MRVVVCAACKTVLGYLEAGPQLQEACQAIALAHKRTCTATEEEYEQSIYDLKFRQITEGLDL